MTDKITGRCPECRTKLKGMCRVDGMLPVAFKLFCPKCNWELSIKFEPEMHCAYCWEKEKVLVPPVDWLLGVPFCRKHTKSAFNNLRKIEAEEGEIIKCSRCGKVMKKCTKGLAYTCECGYEERFK